MEVFIVEFFIDVLFVLEEGREGWRVVRGVATMVQPAVVNHDVGSCCTRNCRTMNPQYIVFCIHTPYLYTQWESKDLMTMVTMTQSNYSILS